MLLLRGTLIFWNVTRARKTVGLYQKGHLPPPYHSLQLLLPKQSHPASRSALLPDKLVNVKENSISYLLNLDHATSAGVLSSLQMNLARPELLQRHLPPRCFCTSQGIHHGRCRGWHLHRCLDLDEEFLNRMPPVLTKRLFYDTRRYPGLLLNQRRQEKQAWSAKTPYDQLVDLEELLAKNRGLWWTANNFAKLTPKKFARICWRALTGRRKEILGGNGSWRE